MEDGELDQGEESVRLRPARARTLPRVVLRSLRIHAQCEDYRAGAPGGADVINDEADREAGKTIACPLLALWGGAGIANETGGPLAIWKQWAPQATGQPIDSGHFLTEENPDATAKALLEFFSCYRSLPEYPTMHPVLRLYEDVLSSAENVAFELPPLPRFIFVVHGSATIAGKSVNEGEAWQGEGATLVRPGKAGVTCWRWELSRGDPARRSPARPA